MRDAFGGIVNISMIVVFLVIVSGYLAFNVSYTKAFRIKNKIITTIEQYEGKCYGSQSGACQQKIQEEMTRIGYNPGQFTPTIGNNDGCTIVDRQNGYVIAECPARNDTSGSVTDNDKVFYKVETAIQIDIPMINLIMANMPIFRLTGNTKLIRKM